MKILIDENLPRKLAVYLKEHECRTVVECGWSGKNNGELLALADRAPGPRQKRSRPVERRLNPDRGVDSSRPLELPRRPAAKASGMPRGACHHTAPASSPHRARRLPLSAASRTLGSVGRWDCPRKQPQRLRPISCAISSGNQFPVIRRYSSSVTHCAWLWTIQPFRQSHDRCSGPMAHFPPDQPQPAAPPERNLVGISRLQKVDRLIGHPVDQAMLLGNPS